jgi:hypothetical protein
VSAGPLSGRLRAPSQACGNAVARSATVLVMTVPLMTVLVTAVGPVPGARYLHWAGPNSPYARREAGLVRGQAA